MPSETRLAVRIKWLDRNLDSTIGLAASAEKRATRSKITSRHFQIFGLADRNHSRVADLGKLCLECARDGRGPTGFFRSAVQVEERQHRDRILRQFVFP